MGKIISLQLPITSLEAYVAAVHALPILGAAEERAYAIAYHEKGDLNAARALVLGSLRFVLYIARGYRGYGLPEGDLIQEGNIGLMKAVKHFDPSVGVRLITFAVRWIKAEIQEFILKNWRIVKVATTKAQRKLFFNLRRYKQKLGWLTAKETHEIAKDLGVLPAEIREMESRLAGEDVAFEAREPDEETHNLVPAHYLEDAQSNPAFQIEQEVSEAVYRERFFKAFRALDERSQDILKSRFLDEPKATLQKLASKYQISVERVRQIEARAISQLKRLTMGVMEA